MCIHVYHYVVSSQTTHLLGYFKYTCLWLFFEILWVYMSISHYMTIRGTRVGIFWFRKFGLAFSQRFLNTLNRIWRHCPPMAEMLHTTQQRQEEKQQQGTPKRWLRWRRDRACVCESSCTLWGKLRNLVHSGWSLVNCLTTTLTS